MKNHISFCVNNSKRLTFCFVNELQDVLRFLFSREEEYPVGGEVVGELIFLFLPVSPLFPCFFLFLVPAIPILPLSRLRLRAHVTRTYIYNVSPSTPFHTSFQIYVLQHPY